MATSEVLSSARDRAPGPPARWRLRRGWRRTTLVVHIVSAGSWIGIDVLVAVLVLTGWFADDPSTQGLAYEALATFVVVPMLVAGLVCLASGVLLGLATNWGLVRYWWVLVKLLLNLVLCVLIVVALEPGMGEVAAYGEEFRAGRSAPQEIRNLFFPPAVSLSALTFATVLAVFKPWGRTAFGRRRGGR